MKVAKEGSYAKPGNRVEGEMKENPHGGRRKTSPNVVKDLPTIGFMFVDQTMGGTLAKRLQEAEDRMAKVSGYRIRMVESAGTQLRRLLPNTNPWSGADCGRVACYTCNQGGERLFHIYF